MLWPTFSLMNCYNAPAKNIIPLPFITAGSDGQPSWGDYTAQSEFYARSNHPTSFSWSDVIISFGGANGTPIDASYYQCVISCHRIFSVIDKYD